MLLLVVRAKNESRSFEFDQAAVTIGRADVNDVVLPTAKVSKRHARIELGANGIHLTDLKSTNGTYVNGRRVTSTLVLGENDRVHVGEFVLTVQVLSSAISAVSATSAGFSAEAQASASTEPSSGFSPSPSGPNQITSERSSAAQPSGSSPSGGGPSSSSNPEDPVTRRGAGQRMGWLDQWIGPNPPPLPGLSSGRAVAPRFLSDSRRETTVPLTVHASMPGQVQLGGQVQLRLWADARNAPRSEGGAASRQRLSCSLEVNVSLPDGKIEAYQADQGLLHLLHGGQSAELCIPLRARDSGAARVEVAVCHRGARIATMTLRPEVRAMSAAEVAELLPESDIQVSTHIESVLPGCGPQVVLRVREYGPVGGDPAPATEPAPSISGSHSTDSAKRRRLKVDLGLIHDETTEILAAGEVPLEQPLGERMRAFLQTQDVERLGTLADAAREQALQTLGEILAALLLPTSVRDVLPALQPGTWLQIDCPETWIPWELLRLGKGLASFYLAERFALTRGGSGSFIGRFVAAPRILLTPPGAEGLVRREQQSLAVLDVRLRHLHRVSEVQPMLQNGLEKGQQVAGWHFSGQGAFDRGDKGAASLSLEDGVITPVQIMPLQRFRRGGQTPPFQGSFVFLNVSEPSAPAAPLAPAGTVQWIDRFQAAGAGAIIATTWPVASAKAGQFVEVFYRALASRRPLCIAIAEAREAVRAEGDVSWLAYAVFGLPGARLLS